MSILSRRSRATDEQPNPDDPSLDTEVPSPTALVVLARVNLMPAAYARRAAVRRARVGAVVTLSGAALVSGLLFLVSWQGATSAQERLDQATFERAMAQKDVSRYSDVPRIFDAVGSAQAQLALAMGNEVRWSFFLNDLALTMPAGVSLETLDLTAVGPGQVPTDTGDGQLGAKLGTLTVTGKALAYNNVANWLDSLAKMDTVADPYVAGLAAVKEESTKVVTFSSTGDITTDTLSGRFSEGAQP
ncbi:MAG: PilN domain-containing protein [Candidatus Nanopelagicales bacterium]